ncbi:MAG: sulfur carrier protein ThiS [Alkalicoccus sp.]|uniref:Sulfur carrier protein ThiS n=1 Tax=Alkalicoccus sp. TaxID=2005376 RepID=A0A651DIX7_9BACI|nr:MAG: sulfur carrier protein ThiS [Alkalicoccus sp.]
MNIQINGNDYEIHKPLHSISDLLSEYNISGERTAVEQNGLILKKEEWPETAVSDGDRIEIVHFVGGG